MIKRMKKNEDGVVILEATFCVLLCMIIMVLFLSLAFWLYHVVMVTVVTNEVASEVAQNYKLIEVQDDGEVKRGDIISVGKYRYSVFRNKFEEANEETASKYAVKRLGLTSMSPNEGRPEVLIETVVDDIGKRHYEVTVTQEYTFLLGGALELIGLEETQTISRTAYVQSTDVLSYVNAVKTDVFLADMLTGNTKAGGAVDSIISAVNSLVQLVRKWCS